MRQNPARRAALVDAAIEVLAREGARGLTFRAVDAQAGVPNGTASNYFRNRDDLFGQLFEGIRRRLEPEADELARTMRAAPSAELVTRLLLELYGRMRADPAAYLALQEMRLEATRRPAIREAVTETLRDNLEENVEFHLGSGLPGDEVTVVLLYLAMNGLILDQLTVPAVLSRFPVEELIAELVKRTVKLG